jgi:hypothetical protein
MSGNYFQTSNSPYHYCTPNIRKKTTIDIYTNKYKTNKYKTNKYKTNKYKNKYTCWSA